MNIIISPAKKMTSHFDTFAPTALPQFLNKSEALHQAMNAMSDQELQTLWKCNDALATLNIERVRTMNLRDRLSPALFTYEGIQYRHLSAHVLEQDALDYLQAQLYIVSGLYGLLRPYDGVTPYRLEMQGKLSLQGHKNLYQFWGTDLASALEGTPLLNLCSVEYSKSILPHLNRSQTPVVTCTFGEKKGDKIVEKGTQCKMARGEMVRWMSQEKIQQLDEVKSFSRLGYHFDSSLSKEDTYVFLSSPSETKASMIR